MVNIFTVILDGQNVLILEGVDTMEYRGETSVMIGDIPEDSWTRVPVRCVLDENTSIIFNGAIRWSENDDPELYADRCDDASIIVVLRIYQDSETYEPEVHLPSNGGVDLVACGAGRESGRRYIDYLLDLKAGIDLFDPITINLENMKKALCLWGGRPVVFLKEETSLI